MNLFELTKDLHEAASKHCELVNGVRIKSVGMRYKQHENPAEDYFEQDVVVHFTRKVKQDSHEFGYLVDNIGNDGCYKVPDKSNSEYNRIWSEGLFPNDHTFNVFRERITRYLNEEELIIDSGFVRVFMSKIRDEIKDAIPVAGMMLPLDLFSFIRKMFNNMDWDVNGYYQFGFEKSTFLFLVTDLKEYGINNPCLETSRK